MQRFIMPSLLGLCTAACGDNGGSAPDAGAVDAAIDAQDAPSASLRFYDYVQAIDVTPDGTTAVFGDIATLANQIYFVDTRTGEATLQTSAGSALMAFATGVSNTGAVSALREDTSVYAGMWTESGGWVNVPSPHASGCEADVGSSWDISADGGVVVGAMWNGCSVEAFRWSPGAAAVTRLTVLGARLGGGLAPADNRATVVSDDGTTAAGWAMTELVDRAPAIWRADGTAEILPRVADDAPGEVLAISADGGVLAGIDANDGVVWAQGGVKITLPRFSSLLPSDPVFPNAVRGDGNVIFGVQGSSFFGTPEAFAWSLGGGLRKVSDLAVAAGLTIPAAVSLTNVTAVSADGRVLVGTAKNADTFAETGFVLRLIAPVP